jgi:hypothetical protein
MDVFNIRQALWAEKNNYLVFPKSGTVNDLAHYNQIGAFFAYHELMKHINNYFPEIVPYTLNDITISYDEKGMSDVLLKEEKAYERLNDSFFDDVTVSKPFTWENIVFENKNIKQPIILLLRDSYAGENYFSKYIAQQFGTTILIHWMNMEHLEEYITKYNPDLVVFESSEGPLKTFAYHVVRLRLPQR